MFSVKMEGSWGKRILTASTCIARRSDPDRRRRARRVPGGRAQGARRNPSESGVAVSHHRGHLGRRRIRQHPGRQRHALASVGVGNRARLGELPRRPGVPFRRGGHAQGRRPLDGLVVHRRHDRPAEIPARQFAAARAAVQGHGFRRDARQRRAAATCARWRCAPPAISPRARCRSSRPRPRSANGRARSATASACRCRSTT